MARCEASAAAISAACAASVAETHTVSATEAGASSRRTSVGAWVEHTAPGGASQIVRRRALAKPRAAPRFGPSSAWGPLWICWSGHGGPVSNMGRRHARHGGEGVQQVALLAAAVVRHVAGELQPRDHLGSGKQRTLKNLGRQLRRAQERPSPDGQTARPWRGASREA